LLVKKAPLNKKIGMTEENLPREFQNLGEYSNKELPTEGVIKQRVIIA
jgi:hypothetical protein